MDPNIYETVEYEDYPIRSIVKSAMFSYGDSEEPCESCQHFLLDLIHSQMTQLIDQANSVAKARKRHPLFIKRLIQYMRLTDKMYSLSQETLVSDDGANEFVLEPEEPFDKSNKYGLNFHK
ncbi:transcription initiation factor IID, 18kD subunit domain-containing protein [Ditylenchus destructor]|uniref:Transcription initiation factor IID, 18kD subunit domain-containing protein n=1 Tax=Ditylenchus destructor TaxID=166010 RepID=A0AAD4N639_9BILA|nr:transcription initiation factor IID, 18kD subunit domain-containing protein [Ditylenchus destructor]